GPGKKFFDRIKAELGELLFIAEDLGHITPEVEELRDTLGFPGMKILQFAFDGNPKNSYLPHNMENPLCVVYTGTHDNDTTNGWYYNQDLAEHYRKIVQKYVRFDDHDAFHWKLITYAYATVARLVVIPVQDILGYGREFRMNTPGKAEGNWLWKLIPGRIDEKLSEKLHKLSYEYNRHPDQRVEDKKKEQKLF
ncbi:MAG TPA: 4-alpha-glucanotransferase, partial [Spirochaetota bacterium]